MAEEFIEPIIGCRITYHRKGTIHVELCPWHKRLMEQWRKEPSESKLSLMSHFSNIIAENCGGNKRDRHGVN